MAGFYNWESASLHLIVFPGVWEVEGKGLDIFPILFAHKLLCLNVLGVVRI